MSLTLTHVLFSGLIFNFIYVPDKPPLAGVLGFVSVCFQLAVIA